MSVENYGNNTTAFTSLTCCTNCTMNVYLSPRVLYKTTTGVWLVAVLSFNILGCFTNLLLFTAIITDKVLRKGSGFLILNFLLIEFITSISTPSYSVTTYSGIYPTLAYCKSYYFFSMLLLNAGYWAAFFLALNRFVAIVFPTAYRSFGSKMVVLLMITTIWSIGGLQALMHYLDIWGRFGQAPIIQLLPCQSTSRAEIAGVNVTFIIGPYLPVLSTGALYAFIFVRTTLSRWGVCGLAPANSRRLFISKMLFFSYLLHCMCFLPMVIVSSLFRKIFAIYPPIILWLGLFYVIASTVNPLLMLVLSKGYRKRVLNCFRGVKQWLNKRTGKIQPADNGNRPATVQSQTVTGTALQPMSMENYMIISGHADWLIMIPKDNEKSFTDH